MKVCAFKYQQDTKRYIQCVVQKLADSLSVCRSQAMVVLFSNSILSHSKMTNITDDIAATKTPVSACDLQGRVRKMEPSVVLEHPV